jgi:hypothetical protein
VPDSDGLVFGHARALRKSEAMLAACTPAGTARFLAVHNFTPSLSGTGVAAGL